MTTEHAIAKARAALATITVGHHVRCAVGKRSPGVFGFSLGISSDGDYAGMLKPGGMIDRAIDAGSQVVLMHRPFGETAKHGQAMRYAAWAETPQDVRANTEAGVHAATKRLADARVPTVLYLGSLQDYGVAGHGGGLAGAVDWAVAMARPAFETSAHLAIDASAKFVSHSHNDLLWALRHRLMGQGRMLSVEGAPRASNSAQCTPEPWPCCVSNRSIRATVGDPQFRLGHVRVLRLGHPISVGGQNWRPSEAAELAQLAIWLSEGRMSAASYCGLDFGPSVDERRAAAAALIPALVRGEMRYWEVN